MNLELPPPPGRPSPRAPRARYVIRPAGWLVIVVALGLLGWLAWRWAGPQIAAWIEAAREQQQARVEPAPEHEGEPREPVVVIPPEPEPAPVPPSARPSFGPELFPQAVAELPPPSNFLPRLVLPPLRIVHLPSAGAREVGSEAQALALLADGQADVAVVSVAALAAAPRAIEAGVRAAWYLGDSPADGAIFPSCDETALRYERLGAVADSLGHFHLLGALSSGPLPRIQLYPDAPALAEAVREAEVTGGVRAGGTREEPCRALPREAFAMVVVRRTDRPLEPADLASVVALGRAPPFAQEVATFFDRERRAPGGFVDLFTRAVRVWLAVERIDSPVSAEEALDSTFLGVSGDTVDAKPRVEDEPAPPVEPDHPPPPAPEPVPSEPGFGHPAWPDR